MTKLTIKLPVGKYPIIDNEENNMAINLIPCHGVIEIGPKGESSLSLKIPKYINGAILRAIVFEIVDHFAEYCDLMDPERTLTLDDEIRQINLIKAMQSTVEKFT